MADLNKIRSWAQNILTEIGSATPPISTAAQLDAALGTAKAGDTLILANTLIYTAGLTLPAGLILQSETWADRRGTRITLDEPAPRFLGGLTALGDNHWLRGLELRGPDPTGTIATMGGMSSNWDRCRILGDPTNGARRGINFVGGRGAITQCYIADCFRADRDAQAIYSQEMLAGGGLLISDCYLSASGECVLFGGGDSSGDMTMPSNIAIEDSLFFKPTEWLQMVGPGKHQQFVKNGLEGKAVRGLRCSRCTFVNTGGISDGQKGVPFVMTPRNQGKKAPWSTVEDVMIEDFTVSGIGNGVLNCIGNDDQAPSGTLTGLTLFRGTVSGLDRLYYGKDASGNPSATGRLFEFDRAPKNVTLDTMSVTGINTRALGYFSGTLPPTGFKASSMNLPKGTAYGWKINNGGQGRSALMAYMPDAVLDSTIV